MKIHHTICDSIGIVGAQVASTAERAILLYCAKHPEFRPAELRAYETANTPSLPCEWEPEEADAWKAQDDALFLHRG